MSETYEEFQRFIYNDMIREWTNCKLGYYITNYNINLVISLDPKVTVEKIMEDFRKSPLIKEVFLNHNGIYVIPK